MSKVAEIDAQIATLQQARKDAIEKERADIIAKVRKDIVDYKITATDLKGVVKGRVTDKAIEEFLDKKAKAEAKKAAKAP